MRQTRQHLRFKFNQQLIHQLNQMIQFIHFQRQDEVLQYIGNNANALFFQQLNQMMQEDHQFGFQCDQLCGGSAIDGIRQERQDDLMGKIHRKGLQICQKYRLFGQVFDATRQCMDLFG